MAAFFLAAAGAAVVLGTLTDVVVTTVSMRGGGPFTLRLTNVVWRLAVRRSRNHHFLEIFGSLLLPMTLVTWLVGLYTGWVLLLSSQPGAVVNTSTGTAAGLGDRMYVVGYFMSTLGNGDFRPDTEFGSAVAVLTSLTGLVLITLAITYMMPVLTSVITSRQVARLITSLGTHEGEMLAKGWDGNDLARLGPHLSALSAPVAELSQRFMAYPVLHYFHAPERRAAIAPSLAALDATVDLISRGVRKDLRPDPITMDMLRDSLDLLLDALEAASIDPVENPSVPSLELLERLGIPTVTDEEWADHEVMLRQRRALITGFVESDGWGDDQPAQSQSP